MSTELSMPNYIDYMNKVKDLEVSCYQQKRLCNGLHDMIVKNTNDVAAWSRKVSAPRPEYKKPIGDYVIEFISPIFIGILGAGLGVALWFVLSMLISLVFILFSIPDSSIDLSWWGDFGGPVMALICAFLGVVLSIAASISNNREDKEKYLSDTQEYDNTKKQLQSSIIRTNKLIPILQSRLKTSLQLLASTRQILQDTYNMGYIYPKYRDIVAVCTMLEYLESGRCDSLSGANGAYNLYENELRSNIIIGKLSNIENKLDHIIDNQRILADVISGSMRQTNRILNSMHGTLEQIEQNTEYTEYYSQVTAQNTTFLSWVKSYEMFHNKK